MSNIYLISDLHLGHKRILEFSPERGGTDVTSHSEWLVDRWNSVVKKSDRVWILGDVCFDLNHLKYLLEMNGQKTLLAGNHDKWTWHTYLGYVDNIKGFSKVKGFWLSHPPIHPDELRGITNIHGHVHMNTLDDHRYINVCVESLEGIPISMADIKLIQEKRKTSPKPSIHIREELT